jgi:hypothetical protein
MRATLGQWIRATLGLSVARCGWDADACTLLEQDPIVGGPTRAARWPPGVSLRYTKLAGTKTYSNQFAAIVSLPCRKDGR